MLKSLSNDLKMRRVSFIELPKCSLAASARDEKNLVAEYFVQSQDALTKDSWATVTWAPKSDCKLNSILVLYDLYQAVCVTTRRKYSCLILLIKAPIHYSMCVSRK